MASTYPGTLDTFPTDKTDGTDTGDETPGSVAVGDHALHHNNLADAVNKIEAETGTNPSGAEATVAAAIAAAGGGGGIPTSIVDAAGDLIVGSGADTVVRLAKGANGTWLRVIDGALAYSGLSLVDIPTGAPGEVLGGTGQSYSLPPGYQYAYGEKTSDTTISTTTAAAATTVATASAFTADGTSEVLITVSALLETGVNCTLIGLIYEGSTESGRIVEMLGNTAIVQRETIYGARKLTPASGSRTYSFRVYRAGANGTVKAGNGASDTTPPAFIRVTKV